MREPAAFPRPVVPPGSLLGHADGLGIGEHLLAGHWRPEPQGLVHTRHGHDLAVERRGHGLVRALGRSGGDSRAAHVVLAAQVQHRGGDHFGGLARALVVERDPQAIHPEGDELPEHGQHLPVHGLGHRAVDRAVDQHAPAVGLGDHGVDVSLVLVGELVIGLEGVGTVAQIDPVEPRADVEIPDARLKVVGDLGLRATAPRNRGLVADVGQPQLRAFVPATGQLEEGVLGVGHCPAVDTGQQHDDGLAACIRREHLDGVCIGAFDGRAELDLGLLAQGRNPPAGLRPSDDHLHFRLCRLLAGHDDRPLDLVGAQHPTGEHLRRRSVGVIGPLAEHDHRLVGGNRFFPSRHSFETGRAGDQGGHRQGDGGGGQIQADDGDRPHGGIPSFDGDSAARGTHCGCAGMVRAGRGFW